MQFFVIDGTIVALTVGGVIPLRFIDQLTQSLTRARTDCTYRRNRFEQWVPLHTFSIYQELSILRLRMTVYQRFLLGILNSSSRGSYVYTLLAEALGVDQCKHPLRTKVACT
jgi:hypothetical protein